jgi:hypothetical protein
MALPPDPGKMESAKLRTVEGFSGRPIMDSAAGMKSDAQSKLAGASSMEFGSDDRVFAEKQANDGIFAADTKYGQGFFQETQYQGEQFTVNAANSTEEHRVKQHNAEVYNKDANHNGKSDYQEIQDEKNKSLLNLGVGMVAAVATVGAIHEVAGAVSKGPAGMESGTGIAGPLGLTAIFGKTIMPDALKTSEGQAITFDPLKADVAKAEMGPTAAFAGRGTSVDALSNKLGVDLAAQGWGYQAPAADMGVAAVAPDLAVADAGVERATINAVLPKTTPQSMQMVPKPVPSFAKPPGSASV